MVGGALGCRGVGAPGGWRLGGWAAGCRAESLDADAAECLTGRMSESSRVVSAERRIAAPAADIFELIADPAQQPRWDGNDNLSEGAPDQRVRAAGEIFGMTNLGDRKRENHVVEFAEGRLIAWKPALPGEAPFGQLWRWELEPQDDGSTLVRHSYDWTDLDEIAEPERAERARNTTPDKLRSSIDRLAALAERE